VLRGSETLDENAQKAQRKKQKSESRSRQDFRDATTQGATITVIGGIGRRMRDANTMPLAEQDHAAVFSCRG
jgi:hypothetical protein